MLLAQARLSGGSTAVQVVCLADEVWQAQNCGLAGDVRTEEPLKRLK